MHVKILKLKWAPPPPRGHIHKALADLRPCNLLPGSQPLINYREQSNNRFAWSQICKGFVNITGLRKFDPTENWTVRKGSSLYQGSDHFQNFGAEYLPNLHIFGNFIQISQNVGPNILKVVRDNPLTLLQFAD
jgi:hypothetical protein